MQGKIIRFKANISDFKVKDGMVKVQLTASTKDIPLDKLNEISAGMITANLEAAQTELIPDTSEVKSDAKK